LLDLYQNGYTGPVISYEDTGTGYVSLIYLREVLDLFGQGVKDWQTIDQTIGMRAWGIRLPHDLDQQILKYQQPFLKAHQAK